MTQTVGPPSAVKFKNQVQSPVAVLPTPDVVDPTNPPGYDPPALGEVVDVAHAALPYLDPAEPLLPQAPLRPLAELQHDDLATYVPPTQADLVGLQDDEAPLAGDDATRRPASAHERAVLDAVHRLFLADVARGSTRPLTFAQVAKVLNKLGLRTSRGLPWQQSNAYSFLKGFGVDRDAYYAQDVAPGDDAVAASLAEAATEPQRAARSAPPADPTAALAALHAPVDLSQVPADRRADVERSLQHADPPSDEPGAWRPSPAALAEAQRLAALAAGHVATREVTALPREEVDRAT